MDNSVLQGTTPTFIIDVDPVDLSLSDIIELELTFKQFNENPVYKHLGDCTIDLESNSVSYHFSEIETLNLNPNRNLSWQIRFVVNNGEIVGTEYANIDVALLLSSEVLKV